MILQYVMLIVLFAVAIVYLGSIVYKSFQAKGCASGCGKCGVDFGKIERQMKDKSVTINK